MSCGTKGKFCIDCKNLYKVEANMLMSGYEECLASIGPPLHNPVTGREIRITDDPLKRRQDPTLCGLEARWFEPGTPLILK
jgi:hypothetical protein